MILHIAIPVPLYRRFDYLPPAEKINQTLLPGVRMRVPFGKREMIGVLLSTSQINNSEYTLKPAIEVLDDTPIFSSALMQLLIWAADYYHHPIGDVFASALPTLLRKGGALALSKKKRRHIDIDATKALSLNTHQQNAVQAILSKQHSFQAFLLHGITGSGKTEVYLQTIQQIIAEKKQALILVPEISLTPQTVERFQERFSAKTVLLHSGLTERARLDAWLLAQRGEAAIVIGTRSAIFTPLLNPGIIVVDEEHDLSFKQQEGFRYNARDLAIRRGQLENIPVVLGSATPSLESLHNVNQKRYHYLSLPERVGNASSPAIHLLDVRNQKLEGGLSSSLITHMRKHLDQQGQILLFLNRRGFAPILMCHACGWMADCQRCDAKLTLHQYPPSLQCHHCHTTRPIDLTCPTCQAMELFEVGAGTQRIAQVLAKHFPDVGAVRIDRDSTRRKGSLQTILDTVHNGEKRILIGTQMLAKGHHFPNITLVAILDADGGLFSADFRAAERMAQLLIQVSGRAGRAERAGEVLIQTHNPEHPLIQRLISKDYTGMIESLLSERQAAEMPPFAYMALLRAEAIDKSHPLNFLKQTRDLMKRLLPEMELTLLGPVPSLMEKRAGRFRAQLLFQANSRGTLHHALKHLIAHIEKIPLIRRVRWSLDVDPLEMV